MCNHEYLCSSVLVHDVSPAALMFFRGVQKTLMTEPCDFGFWIEIEESSGDVILTDDVGDFDLTSVVAMLREYLASSGLQNVFFTYFELCPDQKPGHTEGHAVMVTAGPGSDYVHSVALSDTFDVLV